MKNLQLFIILSLIVMFNLTSCKGRNSFEDSSKNSSVNNQTSSSSIKNIESSISSKSVESSSEMQSSSEFSSSSKISSSSVTSSSSEVSTLEEPKPDPTTNIDVQNMTNKEIDWFYKINPKGIPSGCGVEAQNLLNEFSSMYYLGDTSQNVIYLTFDEGYENGYTSQILDILKNNDVTATFFVTTPYIEANNDLIKRMVNEGHIVGNHSTTHPSMPSTASKGAESFNLEIQTCENTFTSLTGQTMPKFFRPPMGKYSELSIAYTQNLGYKTIFWSFAYADWDPENQPSQEEALRILNERTHPGGIYLLHAVSKTNTEILDSQIKKWKSEGYIFKSLYELPQK